jgi:hypothetical protein
MQISLKPSVIKVDGSIFRTAAQGAYSLSGLQP